MCLVARQVLVVGVADRSTALKELPIQVLAANTNAQAIKCLREQKVHTIVSHWELVDIPDGQLLKNVIEAKPSMPTIAFIKNGNIQQEIAARKLGVDAVLSENIDDDYFRETICRLLGISAVTSMQTADNYNSTTNRLFNTEFDY